jgi:hypothetical protein
LNAQKVAAFVDSHEQRRHSFCDMHLIFPCEVVRWRSQVYMHVEIKSRETKLILKRQNPFINSVSDKTHFLIRRRAI